MAQPFNNWKLAQKKPVAPPAYFDPDTLGNRLDTVIDLLESFVAPSPESQTQSTPGQCFGNSLVAKTPFQLTAAPIVKIAYLQNISAVNVTKGTVNTMTDGVGYILNAASTAVPPTAGDTQVLGPQGTDSFVDLSKYWFTANTTGVVLVCDYLQ